MPPLLALALVGAVAQLTAGSLGMGYGVISTSALLAVGYTPALASAAVHLAEIGTSASLGLAHWRLRNLDLRLVLRLGLPGAVGAVAGAVVLTSLPVRVSAVAMSAVLVTIGGSLLVRYAVRRPAVKTSRAAPHAGRFLAPLGIVGGLLDATGGAGWGPVTTTALLSTARTDPRIVVGSVDAAKLIVSVAASLGFLLTLGTHDIPYSAVGALLVSGVVVAPVAAWLVSRLPERVLGGAAGGLVVLVNVRPLLEATHLTGLASDGLYAAVLLAITAALAGAVLRHRRSSTVDPVVQTVG